MSNLQPPYKSPLTDEVGNITREWQIWFSQQASTTTPQSGTTAQRPIKALYLGKPYFDTTLGYMIHYNGTAWVNSIGIPV